MMDFAKTIAVKPEELRVKSHYPYLSKLARENLLSLNPTYLYHITNYHSLQITCMKMFHVRN